MWLIPDGASVEIRLSRVPQPFYGFHVWRADREAGEFVRLTERPVIPVPDDPSMLVRLGDDALLLQDVTRASSLIEMTRRIRRDPVSANLFSYLFPSVAAALGRSYRDETAEVEGSYRYRVAFVGVDGDESGETLEGSVAVRDTRPGAPTEARGEVEDRLNRLNWVFPRYDGAADDWVVGFHVYRGEGQGESLERVTSSPLVRDDTAEPEWSDRSVLAGRSYTYRVRAVDLLGREGPLSDPVELRSGDPAPPTSPAGLAGAAGDGTAALSWLVSPEPSVVGYHVERSRGLDQPYERITTEAIDVEQPEWVDSTATGGTRFFYRVVAVDSLGRESAPTSALPLVPFDVSPPEQPSDLIVEVIDHRLSLTWSPSASGDVVGYHVYRGVDAAGLVRITDAPVESFTFVDVGFGDAGLVPGDTYLVRITAVDGGENESPPVEFVVTVPDDVPPEAPTGLRVDVAASGRARVSWNASSSLDAMRYVLTRSTSAGTVPLDSIEVGGRFEVDDFGAPVGDSVTYFVLAVDSAGNRGVPAEAGVLLRDAVPPPAPAFAQAVDTGAGVRVEWERAVAADLAGYRVYRSDSPTGVFEAVGALVPVTAERVLIDPSGGSGLSYRVLAVDTSGNESEPAGVRFGGAR